MYSLLIIRPLLYGRDRTAVAYGRRCSGCRGSASVAVRQLAAVDY
jgi:hypothetical protein